MNQIIEQSICNRLLDVLPHGSGINGDWIIVYNNRTRLYYASNYYDAMNESGMYCHVYDFTARYRYNGDGNQRSDIPEFDLLNINFHGERERACCSYGLKNYLYELLTLDDPRL